MAVILNADNGVVSGISGLTTTADNSGVLQFQSSGTATLEISTTGNINIPGTGKRITGDFSNGTFSNRVLFQSSTTNGNTNLGVIPNGTSTTTGIRAYSNSDPTNTSFGEIASTNTDVRINSGITGTGTYQPITFFTNGSERLRIDTSGNVGIGATAPSSFGRLVVSSSAASNSTITDLALQANRSYSTSNNGLSIVASASNGTLGTHDFGAITFNEAPISNGGSAYVNMYAGGTSSAYDNASRFLRAYSNAGAGIDHVALWTGSTERMRIDSSGNVGIGTSSPAYSPNVARTYLSIRGSTGSGILQLTTAAASGDPDVNLGNVEWVNTNNTSSSSLRTAFIAVATVGNTANNNGCYMAFATKADGVSGTGTEAMRIDSTGNLLVGKISPTANGGDIQVSKGITFPATQVAQSDANTLDDYEEGTFTVTNAGDATGTLGSSVGEYVKVGRMVYIRAAVTISTNFSSSALGGLPFVASGSGTPSGISGACIVMTQSGTTVCCTPAMGTSEMYFYTNGNAASSAGGLTTTNNILRVSFVYRSAS